MYLHAQFRAFETIKKMLPHTENTSLKSPLIGNTGWAMESLAANYEEWDLVKQLLKTRDPENAMSVELCKNLLGAATKQNNFEIAEMLLKMAPNNDTDERNGHLTFAEKLIIREIARRSIASEMKHENLPDEIMKNIEELLAASSKIDDYFRDAQIIRAKIINALTDKDNPKHGKYIKEINAYKKVFEREQKLDLAKLVFLKILKAMDIPSPKNVEEQEHYKQIFRDKFKYAFYDILQKTSITFIKQNEDGIYTKAKDLKDSHLKIDDIDFSQLLPKVTKLKPGKN